MMLLRCLTSSESDDGSCECSAALTMHLPLGTLNPHTWARGTGTERNRGGADLVGCRGRSGRRRCWAGNRHHHWRSRVILLHPPPRRGRRLRMTKAARTGRWSGQTRSGPGGRRRLEEGRAGEWHRRRREGRGGGGGRRRGPEASRRRRQVKCERIGPER